MNSQRTLLSHKTMTPQKRWLIIFLSAIVVTSVTLFVAWTQLIIPSHQAHFQQQVSATTHRFQQAIESYILQLERSQQTLVNTLSEDMLRQDPLTMKAWVDEQQWEQQLAYAQSVTLITREQLRARTLSIQNAGAKASESTAVSNGSALSFILIDMVNRLDIYDVIAVEVAKNVVTGQWQLHKIISVENQQLERLGIFYATYSLEGLEEVIQPYIDLGKVVLTQSINNQPPLQFLSMGKGDSEYSQKIKNIKNSDWQLTYQPSRALFNQSSTIPLWFWILAVLSFALVSIFIWVLSRDWVPVSVSHLHESLSNNLLRDKENKIEQHTSSVCSSSDASQAIKADSFTDGTLSPDEEQANLVNDNFPHHIFRAYDIRGLAHSELNHDLMYAIGQAVATEVLAAGEQAMVLGYDARTHSVEFYQCAMRGIISTGCDVIDIGLVPTPLMNFTACQHTLTNSGMIITASHNPADYNGCKMVVNGETLVDEQIQALKNRIVNNDVISANTKGATVNEDHSQAYIDYIVGDVAVMGDWRIVIDAANGASSELAPRLLRALNCHISPLFCDFDGTFPNHDPDPSVAENLTALIEKVKTENADMGFALDGDGDRLIVVTRQGDIIWPDQLLILFAQDVVARNPGSDVVFDIKSTHLLNRTIAEYGGRPVMWKTGHSHIKAKMKETQALLGGEFSGHIFFKERWFGFDDGLYAAVRLLEILTLTGQSFETLVSTLPTTLSTPEIKITVPDRDKFTLVNTIIEQANFDQGKLITIDGLRVDFAQGWGLVRASNTAPALTLRFEAENDAALNTIQQQFQQALAIVGLSLPKI